MRLLLVEDNRDLAQWLVKALRQAHYTVDAVHDGEDALLALEVADYALTILDLALPGVGGMEVLRRLRARGSTMPVIVLTANASLEGRVAGLDEGADDYLAKPFDLAELEARIRAQLRRAHARAAPELTIGDLTLDGRTRLFRLRGEPLSLTPREHAVLEHLVLKSGHTVRKAELLDSVFSFDAEADAGAIEVYVHRVRKKLEGSSIRIVTLRGLGYLLREHDGSA